MPVDHVKKVHKKDWSNEDIRVDHEELALMKKIVTDQADQIQGLITVEGNKAKKKVLKAAPVNIKVDPIEI